MWVIYRVATGQGKVNILQGQGKVGEFVKMGQRNWKFLKVREKVGDFS